MEQIILLDVPFRFGEIEDRIHPAVLWDDREMVLVDCGYTGFMPHVEAAMAEKNLDCRRLTGIFITHHDHDHMGALAAFQKKYPKIRTIAGEKEAPYITGEKKSLRLTQAEEMQENLPEDQRAFGEAFCNVLRNVEPARVDRTVRGGDLLDWCGGCEVVETPGHTPGHLSLYLKNHRTVITGDAAVSEQGRLSVANPRFTLDMECAAASLGKLFAYDADIFLCYHGGIYTNKKETR